MKNLFGFLLLPLFLIADIAPSIQCETPTWVKETPFSLEPQPVHPSQINEKNLLFDTQYHLDEKTFFFHRVVKILTPTGVDNFSHVKFYFDPSYQELMVHQIRIYRDGQWSDRMNSSTSKLIQNENDLDKNLYNGELCLVYFLDDLRVGDVLDFSCSFIGENPAFSSHFNRVFSLQEKAAVEKIYRRIVGHPSQQLFFKPFNIQIEPQISELSPHLKEWVWEASSTVPYLEEDNEPDWYNPMARVHISQYKTWREVAQKITPLYSFSKDLGTSCPSQAHELVGKWKQATDNPVEQATLALRFVQDEIRYQGFEEGIGAFKPTNPWNVFERRFGDCKDKSFLLLNLLKLLDIDAAPVLISSRLGKNLPEALPNPFLFDHVILQISIGKELYWVDPTIQLQGGSLQDNHCPNYYWGLVVSEATNALAPMPQQPVIKPVEIVTSITAKTPDSVEVSTQITRYAGKADMFRKYVETAGVQKVSDEDLKELKKKYGAVTVLSPLSISDDRKNNVIISKESFNISTTTRPGKKNLKIHSVVLAHCLHDGITLDRSSPYAISYPMWVKERISIMDFGTDWALANDEYYIENPSFYYSYASHSDGKVGEILHEIKHTKDHIPVELIHDYWNSVDEIKARSVNKLNIFCKDKKGN